MADTTQFKLPLVQAAQAQKHVTVNEALARLDALAQVRLGSISLATPPVLVGDGAAYFVPVGAVNEWGGQVGKIAIYANGGWVFVAPAIGWRAYVVDIAKEAIFDGVKWRPEASAVATGGAGTFHRVTEFDQIIMAGNTVSTSILIKNGQQVIGVTGRVISAITGTGVTGWELGVAASTNRYGSGLGIGKNSWLRGLSGTPVTYWADTPLVLTALGGNFAGGTVRLAIHSVELEYPRAV